MYISTIVFIFTALFRSVVLTDFFFLLLANSELVSNIKTDAISSSAVSSVL